MDQLNINNLDELYQILSIDKSKDLVKSTSSYISTRDHEKALKEIEQDYIDQIFLRHMKRPRFQIDI